MKDVQNGRNEEVGGAVDDFIYAVSVLNEAIQTFVSSGRASSDTFRFWDNYVSDFSQLLLDFIAATRGGNRDLQFETTGEMISIDFQCGHLNYAKWGTINFLEGILLKEEYPEIYEAVSGNESAVLCITLRSHSVVYGKTWP